MSYIELKNIKKSFDGKEILKDINLSIDKGEFVTFLGSSGCGKTTLLRCLVGLESVDSGTIMLDGKDIINVPAQERGISMIFQQYCLIRSEMIQSSVNPFEKDGNYYYFEGMVTNRIPQGNIIREVVKVNDNYMMNVDSIYHIGDSKINEDYIYLRVLKSDVVHFE